MGATKHVVEDAVENWPEEDVEYITMKSRNFALERVEGLLPCLRNEKENDEILEESEVALVQQVWAGRCITDSMALRR